MNKNDKQHGCINCYEVGREFTTASNGKKVCSECGGTVLSLQEAFDYIAQLKADLEIYKNEF